MRSEETNPYRSLASWHAEDVPLREDQTPVQSYRVAAQLKASIIIHNTHPIVCQQDSALRKPSTVGLHGALYQPTIKRRSTKKKCATTTANIHRTFFLSFFYAVCPNSSTLKPRKP
mmetsp:Transcript_19010/g.31637  ORF Transcript_19010/g.31637 Transcript_19010/m.31637 type:complete len:116 (-) Transcript_19010:291-638(-)